jgi:hypothetical protein
VTVPAGRLFALGVENLLRFLVVFVVTAFTFLPETFDVAVMKRAVETDELAGGDESGSPLVTVAANRRPGFHAGRGGLVVTSHTIVMIDVHDGVFVVVGQPQVLLRLATILHLQVAGVTVLRLFGQSCRVLVMWEENDGPLERSEFRHGVDRDDVGPSQRDIRFALSTSDQDRAGRCDDSHEDEQATGMVSSTIHHHGVFEFPRYQA